MLNYGTMQCTDFLAIAILEGRSLNYATDMCLMDLTWAVVSFLQTLDCLIVMLARLREASNQVLRSPILGITFCRYISFF